MSDRLILLRPFLYADGDVPAGEQHQALKQMVENGVCARCYGALLEGVREEAAESRDGAKCSEQLGELREKLGDAWSLEEFDQIRSGALEAIAERRKRRLDNDSEQARGIQDMIAMLNRTIEVLAAGSARSVNRLKRIEEDLSRARHVQDILTLQGQLSRCLQFVRQEASKELEESARSLGEIENDVLRLRHSLLLADAGIAGRKAGEEAIAALIAGEPRAALAVLAFDRLAAIEARFGATAGERLVQAIAQDLNDQIEGAKSIYQWSRSALVIIFPNPPSEDRFRARIAPRLAALPAERRIHAAGRMAIVLCPHRWLLLAGSELEGAAQTLARIEEFAKS